MAVQKRDGEENWYIIWCLHYRTLLSPHRIWWKSMSLASCFHLNLHQDLNDRDTYNNQRQHFSSKNTLITRKDFKKKRRETGFPIKVGVLCHPDTAKPEPDNRFSGSAYNLLDFELKMPLLSPSSNITSHLVPLHLDHSTKINSSITGSKYANQLNITLWSIFPFSCVGGI